MTPYDDDEIRSQDEREADLARALSRAVDDAKHTPGMARSLRDIEPEDITSLADLARLPIIRRSDLAAAQEKRPPFTGLTTRRPNEFDHIFQSAGPIYAPGRVENDWWRLGRFLHASDVDSDDVIHNTFSYHLTPFGAMFESGARAVGAAVLPAGPGQTDLQIQAARDAGSTVYAGTATYLQTLLDRAAELDIALRIDRAVMTSGGLTGSLRKLYRDRGVMARQCYATGDLGLLAYESEAMEGMIVDEGVIIEIVHPDTGTPVAEGEMGEVLVTTLNPDYPLIRFATGDLSAFMPGPSPCGRTNLRIRGPLGKVDQTIRINGNFVHPGQMAKLIARFPEIDAAQFIIDQQDGQDRIRVQLQTTATDPTPYDEAIRQQLRLSAGIELVSPGTLPEEAPIIDDRRPVHSPVAGADLSGDEDEADPPAGGGPGQ